MPIAADIYYHVYEEGEKLPVVLIHGAGGTHLYWPAQIRRLGGYRVYALDLPGHGKSGGRGQQSISGYARLVIDWMAAVGLHRAVFAGHSMGSAIALTLALDYPEQVLGLVLLGAASRMPVSPKLLENTASPNTFLKAVEQVTAWSYSPETPEQITELAARRMAETRPAVLHGDFLACDAFDVTGRLGEIQQPALVISGDQDRMTPVRNAQFLAGALPAGRFELIAGAGHMVMIEQPAAVAEAMGRFLAEIPYG